MDDDDQLARLERKVNLIAELVIAAISFGMGMVVGHLIQDWDLVVASITAGVTVLLAQWALWSILHLMVPPEAAAGVTGLIQWPDLQPLAWPDVELVPFDEIPPEPIVCGPLLTFSPNSPPPAAPTPEPLLPPRWNAVVPKPEVPLHRHRRQVCIKTPTEAHSIKRFKRLVAATGLSQDAVLKLLLDNYGA